MKRATIKTFWSFLEINFSYNEKIVVPVKSKHKDDAKSFLRNVVEIRKKK